MIELYELTELRLDPPTPEEIVQMSQAERDNLLALSSDTLNTIFKGFLSGERLERFYREKEWLPRPELLNSMLFAGQGNFEGLQEYTYNHIDNLTVELRNPQSNKIISQKVPTDNIRDSLAIEERLVAGKLRRTGEPVVSHIYRSLLRTSNLIHYYNNLHNKFKTNTRFTPEIAEIAYITSNLHDFEEDKIQVVDNSIDSGTVKILPSPEISSNEKTLYLRRSRANKRRTTTVLEDMKLDIDSYYIPYLQKALTALNSRNVDEDMIIDYMMGLVQEEYASIEMFDLDQYVLSTIPIYIKTGADRPDNLATYFTSKTIRNSFTPTPVNKIVAKAQENLSMFNLAELHLSMDGPELFTSFTINANTEEFESASNLPFFPSRWAKLGLLGLSPNQMYRIPENGGLPEVI